MDAIILAIGTNDFSASSHNTPSAKEFKKGYKELIATVRRMNPGKAIICTEPIPESCGSITRDWIRKVVAEANAKGDKQVYFIPINEKGSLLEESDYTDGTTHPTKNGDTKIANYLKDKVAGILGWKLEYTGDR